MATFDKPYSLTSRSYYGPSLRDPKYQPDTWTNRPPSGFYEKDSSSLATAGIVAGGVVAAGFLPFGKGNRVWDKYVGAMRAVEEYSPAGILRTFQASTFFSQFTSQAQKEFFVGGEYLRSDAGVRYASYLSKLAGEAPGTHARILKEGVTFRKGSLFFGSGKDTAVRYAGTVISPTSTALGEGTGFIAGKHFGSGYARSLGMDVSAHRGFGTGDARQFGEIFENLSGQHHRQIIGAKSRLGYVGRQAGAWGTEFVSRFNRLLEAPFEMEPFKTVFGGAQEKLYEKFGAKIQFAVPYGGGTQMLGRLAWKYGAVAGGIGLGYKSLDYLFRTSETLEGTAIGEGLTYGLASIWTKGNIAVSKMAEATGLHGYREAQEDIAPGSTSFARLAGFPLIGGMAAAGGAYGAQVYKMASLQRTNKKMGAAAARTAAATSLREFGGKGFLGYLGRELATTEGLYSRGGMLGDIMRKVASPIAGGSDLSYRLIGKLGPTKLAGLVGAAIGGAAVLPLLPGALIPSTRPEELERMYSGEEEVAVRKGRWWEFGRSAWEGNKIAYYRPHWYSRMKTKAREKSIWGEDYDGLTPFEKFYKKEFTYDLEKKHYADRPYPITSLPFEDVPFIGPLLASTIGKMIKPPVLMHAEEWMGPGGAVKAMAPGFGERRATELGELAPGTPISPYGLEGTIGEQAYRMTEMIGLPGFMMTSLKEALTGTPDLFDQMAQLESARRAFGIERSYWDLEVGGGLGTTEALRRLYPHRRRQIPLYNPIRNTMPEWLPGAGEKSSDFLHGDPFTKVSEGELRLPGVGYAARFPELEGVKPEDYPVIHRYKILGDIAPYSSKYKLALQQVRSAKKLNSWSEYEESIYNTTQEQLRQRKVKKEFDEYEHLSPMGGLDQPQAYSAESSSFITAINKMKATNEDQPGVFTRLFGGYWEALSHNAETAMDTMTPVSPAAKLIHMRTAIEDYENSQVYGTENAFWSHPMRDFIRPFLAKVGASMGFRSIPEHIKERRDIEEQFDMLEYVKHSRLANLARMSGDTKAAKEFETKKNETLFGVNPFTYNYSNLFRSLPRRERDYFNSFAAADTTEERAKILELVPDNEKALYIARWKHQFKEDIQIAEKNGLLSEDQIMEADRVVAQINEDASTEGLPTSKDLFAEYVATRTSGESYPDWYRRTKLLSDKNLPSSDWVGWHPSVDLEDIKLKLIQNMGEDMHEYDLWPSRAQALINKPYLNDAIAPLVEPESLNEGQMFDRINDLFLVNQTRADIFLKTSWGTGSNISVDMEQDIDIEGELAKLM